MVTLGWATLMVVGLMAVGTCARPDPYASPEVSGDEIYSELADVMQKLRHLKYLSDLRERTQSEEEYMRNLQQLVGRAVVPAKVSYPEDQTTVFTEMAHGYEGEGNAVGRSNLNKLFRVPAQVEPAPKPLPYQKTVVDKKSNSYMAPCHFKLCNMGRKRNIRLFHFWN